MQDNLDIDRLTTLSLKYISGVISPKEELELNGFLDVPGNRDRFNEIVSKEQFASDLPYWEDANAREAHSMAAIGKEIEGFRRPTTIVSIRRWGLVAAGVAGLVLCYMLYEHGVKSPKQVIASVQMQNLKPGGQRAILTLSSGLNIVLDSLNKGEVGEDAGSKIVKSGIGSISYSKVIEEKPPNKPEEISYNTLKTPKGGMYEIVLPDHSKVFLNSASSLKYPTVFLTEGPRVVELTGEAYFMVHADPARPFQVSVQGKTVEALGTIFNINGYDDEPSIDATLLEGSVRVSDNGQSLLLTPGQQAQIVDTRIRVVSQVDTESVVAWKNGDFRFMDGVSLEEVLRQLSRWYNVEVVYTGDKPKQKFFGVVSRNLPAIEVFKALERSGFHFTVVDNKVEVSQ